MEVSNPLSTWSDDSSVWSEYSSDWYEDTSDESESSSWTSSPCLVEAVKDGEKQGSNASSTWSDDSSDWFEDSSSWSEGSSSWSSSPCLDTVRQDEKKHGEQHRFTGEFEPGDFTAFSSDSMEEDAPRDTFGDILRHNGEEFDIDFGEKGILYRSQRINLKETNISPTELTQLTFTHDIDGISMITNMSDITLPIYSIRFSPGKDMAKNIKKHFGANDIDISTARGFQISQSGEYSIFILIASRKKKASRNEVIATEKRARYSLMEAFLNPTQEAMRRYSFRRNDIEKANKWFKVAAPDRKFILKHLERVILKDKEYIITPFVFSFGQKSQEPLDIASVAEKFSSCVVHAATNISAPAANLLWSRQGTQQLVSGRGKLYKCLTLRECCNYQSIPGYPPNIHSDLKAVVKDAATIKFLQLYGDTPNLHVPYRHPVTASLLCDTWHHKTRERIKCEAVHYIQVVRQNSSTLIDGVPARIEVVVAVNEVTTVRAKEVFNIGAVCGLIERYALLVPLPTLKPIKDVSIYLVEQLSMCFDSKSAQRAWQSLQLECSLEMLFWGHLNVPQIKNEATALGPGSYTDRSSLSDQLDCLALFDGHVGETPESPPPLHIWLRDFAQIQRTQRLYEVTMCMLQPVEEVGRKVVSTMLLDLRVDPSINLCDGHVKSPYIYAGNINVETLAQRLCDATWVYPMVSGHVLHQLKVGGLNSVFVVKEGILAMGLTKFPRLAYTQGKPKKVHWPGADMMNIVQHEGDVQTFQHLCHEITEKTITAMEGYTRGRLLEAIKTVHGVLPWVPIIWRKLKGMNLSTNALVSVVIFATGIILLMNNCFCDFQKLQGLPEVACQPKCFKAEEGFGEYTVAKLYIWKCSHPQDIL